LFTRVVSTLIVHEIVGLLGVYKIVGSPIHGIKICKMLGWRISA
jgi:hypothetical protein